MTAMRRTLGVCYYPEHWPEEQWTEDASRMAETGLTWVRIGEFAWGRIEPEPGCADPEALRRVLEQDLRTAFHLRIPVILAAAGELPRFELKARRWVEVDA